MCSVAVYAPAHPSLKMRTLRRRASFPGAGPRKSWQEWYEKLQSSFAKVGSDNDEELVTKRIRDSRKSLLSWLNAHANLPSDVRASDSDENAQATSLPHLLNAFNGLGENSKFHELLLRGSMTLTGVCSCSQRRSRRKSGQGQARVGFRYNRGACCTNFHEERTGNMYCGIPSVEGPKVELDAERIQTTATLAAVLFHTERQTCWRMSFTASKPWRPRYQLYPTPYNRSVRTTYLSSFKSLKICGRNEFDDRRVHKNIGPSVF